jgi:hypothetical protein
MDERAVVRAQSGARSSIVTEAELRAKTVPRDFSGTTSVYTGATNRGSAEICDSSRGALVSASGKLIMFSGLIPHERIEERNSERLEAR